MKILITGATGFVGKNLIKYLKLVGYTDFITPDRKVLESFKLNDLEGVNIIIHLAGKAHDLKRTSSPEEYYKSNKELTEKIFELFLKSRANLFLFFSSVKAIADEALEQLTETTIPNPKTHYGISKLLAENFILNHIPSPEKRFYILRPCMIHGPGNKGNLNLLFQIVKRGFPWPLGSYKNSRSFCSIDNVCFIVKELIEKNNIESGVYILSDDEPISTNDLIKLIAESLGKKAQIWNTPPKLITMIAKFGDLINLPINTERLNKLTETYTVSNLKIKMALNKTLPISSRDGLMKTLNSFKEKSQ